MVIDAGATAGWLLRALSVVYFLCAVHPDVLEDTMWMVVSLQ